MFPEFYTSPSARHAAHLETRPLPRETRMNKLRITFEKLAHWFGIGPGSVPFHEATLSGIGGCIAIFCVVLVSQRFVGTDSSALLVASMGASAVLLFALPHGPLSQPWAVVGGHGISALVGVTCAAFIADPVLSAALAVGVAIGCMQVFRCVHPPGGATALSAVVGGPGVHALGVNYVLTPVLLNAAIIVCVAVIFHGLPTRRRYPMALARGNSTTR